MMADGKGVHEGDRSTSGQPPEIEEPAWVVVKSLLETNDTCTDVLEEFVLYSATNRMDELPADTLSARLDELIEKQRQTITELELARDAISELESEQ
jgi:hypothetical protein